MARLDKPRNGLRGISRHREILNEALDLAQPPDPADLAAAIWRDAMLLERAGVACRWTVLRGLLGLPDLAPGVKRELRLLAGVSLNEAPQ